MVYVQARNVDVVINKKEEISQIVDLTVLTEYSRFESNLGKSILTLPES